jgi:hypothetical protein
MNPCAILETREEHNMTSKTTAVDRLITETNRITLEIRLLKSKHRLTDRDLQKLAGLKADLLRVCPSIRYDWIDGKPVVDILKSFQQIGKET